MIRTAPRVLLAMAVAATLLVVVPAAAARAASSDVEAKAATWDEAAALLGTAGSLWDPVKTVGLSRPRHISVIADGLTFARTGRGVTGGDTFAGAQYGRGARTFTISEKWSRTGWAAEPAFATSMAKVGVVSIRLGLPGTRIPIRATVYANCFVQPADADPMPVPSWFRCAQSHVLTTGGVLVMTARPASTMTAPGSTSIVIQSTGITYDQLVTVAASLQQVAGASAGGAGSAQMVGMCQQMTTAKMTFDQANSFATTYGYSARVGSIDGVPQAVTADYRPDRFTVAMVSNTVKSCTYG